MGEPHISLSSLPSLCQKFHNWWKFDKVLTKITLHRFFSETWCVILIILVLNVHYRLYTMKNNVSHTNDIKSCLEVTQGCIIHVYVVCDCTSAVNFTALSCPFQSHHAQPMSSQPPLFPTPGSFTWNLGTTFVSLRLD